MNRKEHHIVKDLFRVNSNIDDFMDAPSRLFGSKHRLLFHDFQSVRMLSLLRFLNHSNIHQFIDDYIASLLHLLADQMDTNTYLQMQQRDKNKRKGKMLSQFIISQILKK